MNGVLLPAESLPEYFNASVGNYLLAPANPTAGDLHLNELTCPSDINRLADVQHFDDSTGMSLINKKFPHAQRDIMWLQSEDEPLPTLQDYLQADPELERTTHLFRQMGACAAVLEQQNDDYVGLSWSNDPLTFHRASMQGEKRLHFHLTARQEELYQLPAITTSVGGLSFIDRRRLAEEFSYVGAKFFADYNRQTGDRFNLRDIHPTLISLDIGDWEDLSRPETVAKVADFIQTVQSCYDRAAQAFGGEREDGQLADTHDEQYDIHIAEALDVPVELEGVQLLANFISRLVPWCKRDLQREVLQLPWLANLSSKDLGHLTTAVTPLKGLSYSAAFSKYGSRLYLHMRVCKFSDLGGAGCAVIDGMPVRIKKGKTPMSPEQIREREAFVSTVVRTALAA